MHCPRLNGIMRAGDLELTRKKRREEQEEGSQRMAGLGGAAVGDDERAKGGEMFWQEVFLPR